ncbi:MAG: heparin lyase I family protein [Planctomycetes bacterium]|nr:heparin lyase I family protein [Planctomycetota bacterium]
MRHVTCRAIPLLLTTVLGGLFHRAPAQGKPEDGWFEIQGDYGSTILSNGNVQSPGPSGLTQSLFRQAYAGRLWEHWTDQAYMGARSYKVRVLPNWSGVNDRSEQMMMTGWDIGPASPHGDTMYFTFAVWFETPPPETETSSLIFSQLWQDARLNPFLYFSIGQGYLRVQARGDALRGDGIHKNVWTDLLDPVQNSGKTMPLQPRHWYRFMFRVTPGRGLLAPGSATVWLMENETGAWRVIADVHGVPMSWTTAVARDDPRTPAQLWTDFLAGKVPLADRRHATWKLGSYRMPMNATTRLYVDNISWANNNWNLITKNRTVGYHRHIVHLGFGEYWGSTAADSSGDSNGGWSYANHGQLVGPSHSWFTGAVGNCLYFDGVNDYVKVPIAGSEDEFDTGNYLSLSTWLSTDDAKQTGSGLITIDEYSTTYKARLYLVSHDTVQLAVRHPDDTRSYISVRAPYSLADGSWHHVAGTYNRFAPADKRLKLYVDGVLLGEEVGVDKPVSRGNNFLYVGKFSGNYFHGRLDEVRMCNFELAADQVRSQVAVGRR